MLIFIIFLIFCTVALVGYAVIPVLLGQAGVLSEKQQQKLSHTMENIVSRNQARQMSRWLVFAPIIAGITLFLVFPETLRPYGLIGGLILGFIFPSIYIRYLTKKTKDKFSDQLIDALMIMSSSFRGGLSLTQALEAVVDEMPDPINKEISMVLGENKMGVSIEEAMNHLYTRMPSPALQQMITAILLARETGGNLPVIFTRIVNNIREHKKIQQMLDTLTLQGKIQGAVMSLLPIAFGFVVFTTNRRIFDHMFVSEIGKAMLMIAFFLWIFGVALIWKVSTFKDY